MGGEAKQAEDDGWKSTLQALDEAVTNRLPDAEANVTALWDKLHREISAKVIQREICDRALRDRKDREDKADLSGNIQTRIEKLSSEIEFLTGRMADLRSIQKRVKSAPRTDGKVMDRHGINPEYSLQNIPDTLKVVAMDLQWGWAVLVGKTQPKDGGYEPREPGQGEPGALSSKAEQQYLDWVKEMHRSGMSPWAVEDFVCKARGWLEIAKLRRVDVEIVRFMVLTGLMVYRGMFTPLDRRE